MSTILQQQSRNSWLQIPEMFGSAPGIIYADRVSLETQADPIQLLISHNVFTSRFKWPFWKVTTYKLCAHTLYKSTDP